LLYQNKQGLEFSSHFSATHIYAFAAGGLLLIFSLWLFLFRKNTRPAIILLFLAALVMRFTVIDLDQHLHSWDEKYHALVAHNMTEHPFLPTLFEHPFLSYDYQDWTSNHIWLHKQPLFLWQMALSLKVFGISAFNLRIPSALMSALLVLLIYRIGTLLLNRKAAYLGAFLYSVNYFLLDFTSGSISTDHNDLTFIFYITLSIWAFTEYKVLNRMRFIWLIGLFAACAFLNKWMTGLLVFSGWGLVALFYGNTNERVTEFKNLLKAFALCVVLVVPWQIFILNAYPQEASYELQYNGKHFFDPVEGHGGDVWFHFERLPDHYGWLVFLLIPALIVFFTMIKKKELRLSFATFIFLPFIFFSAAATKMNAFCLITAPLMFLALGNLFYVLGSLFQRLRLPQPVLRYSALLALCVIGYINLDLKTLERNHTDVDPARAETIDRNFKRRSDKIAKMIRGNFDPLHTVVFNTGRSDNISFMFFSGITAYSFVPDSLTIADLSAMGIKILMVDDLSAFPAYIRSSSAVKFISADQYSEKRIRLKASNGMFVCDDKTRFNGVYANRELAGDWETFTLVEIEKGVCVLRSSAGKLLSTELGNKAEITAHREKRGDWETFILFDLGEGKVAFKSINGKFLKVDEQTLQLFANGDRAEGASVFQLIPL
jgi:4-amino-4-deoxy-L-arabinose transferase